jgi:hypothetical protein
VFFEVVGKPPKRVRPGDVLAFMTAQRTGQPSLSPQLQPSDPSLYWTDARRKLNGPLIVGVRTSN